MQLKKVIIENFKCFERLEIPFTDRFGRVREFTVIAGPNGTGKTTVLEAIAWAMMQQTELPFPKPVDELRGAAVLRGGSRECRVSCDVVLSEDEYEAVQAVTHQINPTWAVSPLGEGRVTTTYPRSPSSWPSADLAGSLVKGRAYARELVKNKEVSVDIFRRLGGLFYFDQERHFPPNRVKSNRAASEIPFPEPPSDEEERLPTMWSELKQYLVDLGVDARLEPEGWQAQVFAQIAERYHQLFAPRKLAGVVPLEGGTRELRFHDGHQDYRFSGLSSGEQQALLFLAYFVRQRIHRSIVLIDEVELHLHPSLQIEFLKQLPSLGDDNQFILTTHSPYVAEFFPLEAVFTFGALTPGKGR